MFQKFVTIAITVISVLGNISLHLRTVNQAEFFGFRSNFNKKFEPNFALMQHLQNMLLNIVKKC